LSGDGIMKNSIDLSARSGLSALSCAVLVALSACASKPETASSETTSDKAASTESAPVALISRQALLGNPERTGAQISPNGEYVGYLAPKNGVMNVYVAKRATPNDAKAITDDQKRPIRGFFFAYDNQHALYLQDVGGNENFHIMATDLATGVTRDLTPYEGARANISGVSDLRPNEILVSINDRDKSYFDLYSINIKTGARTLIEKNDQGFAGYITDDDFAVKMAIKPKLDGGSDVMQKDGAGWKVFTSIGFEDAGTGPAGLTRDGKTLYMQDSRGRDTAALFAIDLASGSKTLVHEDARADIGGSLTDQKTGKVQAVAVNYLRNEWTVLDDAVRGDLDFLRNKFPEFAINGRTHDDQTWLITGYASNKAPTTYFYDRKSKSVSEWFDLRPALKTAPLQTMHPVVIEARDGLKMVSYYTLPRDADPDGDGKADKAVPMVLRVHGGPWARDAYGLNSTHQLYANRGYATLSVNFRASTGFGKAFLNAGNLQWSKTMHDDLIDAVRWAENQGIAIKGKTAIAGGSYGGYATLAGLTYTPDEFACGVDIVGPSNLNTLLSTIPPYWKAGFEQMVRRVGDPRTEDGKKLLEAASPLTHAAKIKKPLLIGQGANDPRVKQAESDQIIAAMEKNNLPVTYVLFPDEGHGFARPENNMAFVAVEEQFLASCLGGRAEPLNDAFKGSSITIPKGASLIAGAQAALGK
jgi:dipeptidyl aminopeptidase/acylaminoacyl peptidase